MTISHKIVEKFVDVKDYLYFCHNLFSNRQVNQTINRLNEVRTNIDSNFRYGNRIQ